MRVDLGESDQVEIGFAPLIDCIFLLLIFFLVATSFTKQEENKKNIEVPVDLPNAAASFDWSKADNTPVILSVDKSGQFYYEGKAVSAIEMRDKLKLLKEKSPNQRLRLDGDRLTPFQNIVHLLDLCQFEGLTNIGVHTMQ